MLHARRPEVLVQGLEFAAPLHDPIAILSDEALEGRHHVGATALAQLTHPQDGLVQRRIAPRDRDLSGREEGRPDPCRKLAVAVPLRRAAVSRREIP